MKKIKLAYSPDTDDAFMAAAMREKLIDWGDYDFEFTTADIQKLNDAASHGIYDVCAISIAAYPFIKDDYIMMPIGASIGDKFGPSIVVKKDSTIHDISELLSKSIALPGAATSAFFAATAVLPKFTAKHMAFDKISAVVESGEVDCGILIHESQLTPEESGLRKIADLGILWDEKYHLPLPLGTNAIRRDLGKKAIQEITSIYRASVQYGLDNREETIKKASSKAIMGLPYDLANEYIDRYVNHRSLKVEDDVLEGIKTLLSVGAENNLCPNSLQTEFIYS